MSLSVIIPVYNSAPYLRRCVESVLSQTYRDMEIILVDDGSTDESGAICDEYASASFASLHHSIIPIRVIHKPNGGSSTARNTGLKIAKGDYVVFLDSDDEWLIKEGVETMMRRLLQRPSDMLLFKRVDVYPEGNTYTKGYDENYIYSHTAQEVFDQLVCSGQLSLSSCFQLVKREIIEANNLRFPEGIISGEDTTFSCQVWQYARKVDAINLDMYGYCHRSNSVTTSYSIRNLLSYNDLFIYWKNQIALLCVNHKAIGALLANMYVSAAYSFSYIAYKDRKRAKQILLAHQDLLSYAASKKSLRMKSVVDKLGINAGIFIFATYGWLKKYYMAFSHSLAK